MASLTLATEHQVAVDLVSRLAIEDLVSLWRQIDPTDARAATAVLSDWVPDIVAGHGDTAAVMGADYYADSRAAAAAPGTYRPTLADLPPAEQVQVMVRWATGPLWSDTPDFAAALEHLAQGTDRLVRLPDRNTITDNAHRDPAARGVIRYTRGDACGFCLLMATRPDHATLTGAKPGRWHDHCRCGVAPSFGPADDWPDPAELYRDFRRVTRGLRADEARRTWDRHVRSQRQT